MYRRRNAELRGGLNRRVTRVAARADNRLRAEAQQDFFGLRRGAQEVEGRYQIVPDFFRRERAVKVRDMHGTERIARLFEQVAFDTALRAHEQELRAGAFLPDTLCQREGGVDVSGGAAAGEKYPFPCLFHTPSRHNFI